MTVLRRKVPDLRRLDRWTAGPAIVAGGALGALVGASLAVWSHPLLVMAFFGVLGLALTLVFTAEPVAEEVRRAPASKPTEQPSVPAEPEDRAPASE